MKILSRCTARWRYKAGDLLSFLAVSLDEQLLKILSTPFSKTRKMFCWSCRKRWTAVSGIPWSSPTLCSRVLTLGFWLMVSRVTHNRLTALWKITSFSALFQNQLQVIMVSKASNQTIRLSNLKIATKIPTASSRSCQTTAFKRQTLIIMTTWSMRSAVLR